MTSIPTTASSLVEIQTQYSEGECHILALVLQQQLGGPLLLVVNPQEPYWEDEADPDNIIPSVVHVYALDPKTGLAWDAWGARPEHEVLKDSAERFHTRQEDLATEELWTSDELKTYVGDWAAEGETPIDRPLTDYTQDDLMEAKRNWEILVNGHPEWPYRFPWAPSLMDLDTPLGRPHQDTPGQPEALRGSSSSGEEVLVLPRSNEQGEETMNDFAIDGRESSLSWDDEPVTLSYACFAVLAQRPQDAIAIALDNLGPDHAFQQRQLGEARSLFDLQNNELRIHQAVEEHVRQHCQGDYLGYYIVHVERVGVLADSDSSFTSYSAQENREVDVDYHLADLMGPFPEPTFQTSPQSTARHIARTHRLPDAQTALEERRLAQAWKEPSSSHVDVGRPKMRF